MIKDLKELTEFLKICRKQGVTEIKFDGVSVCLGPLPKKVKGEEPDDAEIPTDELTPEQLMYFSAGGPPEQ